MMDYIIGLVKAAKFPNKTTQAVGGFSRTTVVNIRKNLNKRGVPDMNRFLLLNSDYHAALAADTSIVANLYNRDADTITTGDLPKIHGFSPSEYASLNDNGENLVGFAGNKEAIIVASRLPAEPSSDVPIPGIITTVTDPRTGLSVQLRQHYDMNLAKEFRNMVMLFGGSATLDNSGDGTTGGKIERITSA
jgi:hypothetical protein